MTQLLSFEEAISKADENKHLLLGNGFSIDWKSDIFKYDALVSQADFSSLSIDAQELFSLLGTTDFESIIEALRKAADLSKFYETSDATLAQRFLADADLLKEILAKTIAASHPEQPNEITKNEYEHARQFLASFKSIHTLNYDLLLYWVLMHEEGGGKIKCDDGFRDSDDDSADYVVWDNGGNSQNIHYLHGALHLFDAGTELQKYTWTKTGIKLIDQIRGALDRGLFPLIVAEGTSDEKLTRINHSGYLSRGRRSFANIGGSLFIHGHSLADNDDHILMMISETKINKLFVSLMSEPDAPENASKILKIQRMVEERKAMVKMIKPSGKKPARQELEVYFYKADSAHVWR